MTDEDKKKILLALANGNPVSYREIRGDKFLNDWIVIDMKFGIPDIIWGTYDYQVSPKAK